jgi:hypothetical protein
MRRWSMAICVSLLAMFMTLGIGERRPRAEPVGGTGGMTCCIDGTTLCYPCGGDGGGDGGGGPGGGGGGSFGCYNCRTSGACQHYYFGGTDCSEYDGAGNPGCFLYNPCTGV